MLAPRALLPAPFVRYVEGFVSWFLGQSWLIILLSILLGLLIGWALWRRPWHKRYFGESEAVTTLTREHSRSLADKDTEISRLHGLLDERAAAGAAVGGGQHVAANLVDADLDADADADLDGDADLGEGAEERAHRVTDEARRAADEARRTADEAKSHGVDSAVPTAESIDLEHVDVPSVDVPSVEVDNAETANIDMAEIEAAQVDVSNDASATAQVLGEDSELRADAAVAPAAFVDLGEGDDTISAAASGPAGTAGGEDDLERIEGIGPRIASALNSAGITTFLALAESDVAALQSALESGGLRFAPSLPTWSRQARLLAEGDEAGFLELTEQLVAGRDVGRRG